MIRTALEVAVGHGAIPQGAALALTPIIVDEALEWHDRSVDAGRDIVSMVRGLRIRPPWAHTWLDAKTMKPDESGYSTDLRMGVEIYHGDARWVCKSFRWVGEKRALLKHVPDGFFSIPEGIHNAITGQLIAAGPAKAVYVGGFVAFCDDEWRHSHHPFLLMSRGRPDMQDPATANLAKWATTTCHMLGLLHVKNAELVDVGNRADRRRALRAGGTGLRVKELVIRPLRRTLHLMREVQSHNPGQPLPLHLCRGHFKTFTAERPLLGRLVGTFWWEPHLRGSEHMGITVNDRASVEMSG